MLDKLHVFIAPRAEADMNAAIDWYENQVPGLGGRCREAIERTIDHIATFPLSAPLIADRLRRCVVRHFPYVVIYRPHADRVDVVRVLHDHSLDQQALLLPAGSSSEQPS